MKAVKSRKTVGLCRFFVWLLLFVPHVWFSLRDKNFYETALYSVAIFASVFVTALFLRDEGREKVGQDEHREETTP